jgi:hypothetical protein
MPGFQASIGPTPQETVERLVQRTKRLAKAMKRAEGDKQKELKEEFERHHKAITEIVTYLQTEVPELKAVINGGKPADKAG